MAVDRTCETELCLRLGSGHHSSSAAAASAGVQQPRGQPQQQNITIFYNGQICACDVTETQARAIINMAKQEAEERNDKKNNQEESLPSPMPQLLFPGVSTKLSLQRFLEKRKMRICAASSPYTATSHTRRMPLHHPS